MHFVNIIIIFLIFHLCLIKWSCVDSLFRQGDKSTPKTHLYKIGNGGGGGSIPSTTGHGGVRINTAVASLLEKVVSNSNNSLSITHVISPSSHHVAAAAGHQKYAPAQTSAQMQIRGINNSSSNNQPGLYRINNHINNVNEYRRTKNSSSFSSDKLKKLTEKIRVKKAEKAALKVKAKPMSLMHGKPVRPVGRPLGSTNANRLASRGTNGAVSN